MRVLLIHPNQFAHRYISVGIAMISAVLKREGHEVRFFDTSRYQTEQKAIDHSEESEKRMHQVLQFLPVDLPEIKRSDEEVLDALNATIKAFQPELIGFSITSSEFLYMKDIVKNIKQYSIPVVVGGTHATVAPMDVLKVDGVDMVVLGEGEGAVLELVEALEKGTDNTAIENVYFKKKDGIIANRIRPYLQNLDELPFMDVDIFDPYHSIGAYQGKVVKYARFEAGRGCPYRCTYCINSMLHDDIYKNEKKHVRRKSPGRAIDELRFLDEKIDYDIVRFVDETFLSCSIEWLGEFVERYRAQIDKPLVVATRPESVTLAKLKSLRKAHEEIQITMGIESGSERIRREVLNRRMSNQMIMDAYELCHRLGFSTAAFNMIGLPGETREDFFETIKINKKVNVQTPILSYFYPFPGCQLRDRCIKEGYVEDKLHEVDYSVASVLNLPNFSKKEIEGLKRTFVMYVRMDESLYPEIKKAEHSNSAFERMAALYNENFIYKKAES